MGAEQMPSVLRDYGAFGLVAIVLVSFLVMFTKMFSAWVENMRTLPAALTDLAKTTHEGHERMAEVIASNRTEILHAIDSSRAATIREIDSAKHDLAAAFSEHERLRDMAREGRYRERMPTPRST